MKELNEWLKDNKRTPFHVRYAEILIALKYTNHSKKRAKLLKLKKMFDGII